VNKIHRKQGYKLRVKEPINSKDKKLGMPIYECTCGENILILPDLSTMDKAIKKHVTKHKKLTGWSMRYEYLVEQIIDALSTYCSKLGI
jgi:hypothetical protein